MTRRLAIFTAALLAAACVRIDLAEQDPGWTPSPQPLRSGDLPALALWGPWAPRLPGHMARQSTWDRTGANSDNVQIRPGEIVTIFDAEGPGIIRRIWLTTNAAGPIGRTVVLRMFWDGSEEPAVEAPLGDLFGVGNGMQADVNSWPLTVTSRGRSRNCWWPMPFADGARITVANEGPQTHSAFYCHVDYLALDEPPPTRERFHAQYRQAYPADSPENYVLLETEGRGHYTGVVYSIESTEPNWWGEGDELIAVDGYEPLRGTGTEDYFSDAWGTREYSFLFHGTPVCEGYEEAGARTTMYRFHILDPIPFEQRIHVSIEHGTENNRADNLSSLAFWYQETPTHEGPALPPVVARLVGEDKREFIRQRAWQLAAGDEPSAPEGIAALHPHAEERQASLLHGLELYARGKAQPSETILAELGRIVDEAAEIVHSLPSDELYSPAELDLPTDPDAPVPSPPVRVLQTLQRAQFDLERRLALARGNLEPGDEVVVEVRDALAQLTPPPTFEATEDWTYSYAKVDDPHLMGAGAHFTYGDADPSWARFTPAFPASGEYEVLVIFSYGANAGETRYEVRHADGPTEVPLAQHGRPGTPGRNNAVWHSLGTFRFEQGQDPERGSVTLNAAPGTAIPNEKFECRAYADAVRFIFRGE